MNVWEHSLSSMYMHEKNVSQVSLLAPAVTVGETEGDMDSASVFFASSFAYNFVRK